MFFPSTGCGSEFKELNALVGANCRGNIAVVRALFAALTADARLLEEELSDIDDVLGELMKVDSIVTRGPLNRKEFMERLRVAIFDTKRLLAVAAAAAWYGHDEARVTKYLAYAESHARAVMEEHVELVLGKRAMPDPRHSPSDYSVTDMEIFAAVGQVSPQTLVEKMRALHYTSPARLAAIVTTRSPEREALATWVVSDFPQACTDCGLFPLLDATFRRREAARLAGAADLEARLRAISQKLGKVLLDENFAIPVVAFESLLGR